MNEREREKRRGRMKKEGEGERMKSKAIKKLSYVRESPFPGTMDTNPTSGHCLKTLPFGL